MKIYLTEHEAEVAGTHADLASICTTILTLMADDSARQAVIPTHSVLNPQPYDKCLAKLIVKKAKGKLRVHTVGNDLVIEGSEKFFKALASYFRFDDGASFPKHHHLEYYPDHELLQQNELGLVIGFERPGQ